ncbi:MAG: M28 family peptidase, partial [Planctomycetia bacterium]
MFCSYGIESEALSRNDFEGLELTGKVALILRGTPPDAEVPDAKLDVSTQPSKEASPHGGGVEPLFAASSAFTKVMNAKRRGAKAVVLLTPAQGPALPAFDAASNARAGIPALALSETATLRLFPVIESSEPAAAALELYADVRREDGPARNVLGRLRGRDSSRALVIGAHYDHLGHGGDGSLAPDKTGEIHNGADDNASGTAVVLEVARTLAAGAQPDCDVIFALWSGEELGLIGSERWAASPEFARQRILANLNLDMVGRAGSGKLQVLGAGTGEGFAEVLARVGPQSGLQLAVSTQGGAMGGSSDHQSFLKRQVPALHLFSGLHTDYHKPSDDTERFEADGAAKVAVLTTLLARELAGLERVAFVQPAIEAGRERGEGGFRAWFGSVPNYTYGEKGVLIDGTSKGSPAERAGFLAGDVLQWIGDVELSTVSDMVYALQRYKPGDVVPVKYLRDGKQAEVRVTLAMR